MSSAQEYIKKLSTEQLTTILEEHCSGQCVLSSDTALQVCAELTVRDPKKPDVYEAFRHLCSMYLS